MITSDTFPIHYVQGIHLHQLLHCYNSPGHPSAPGRPEAGHRLLRKSFKCAINISHLLSLLAWHGDGWQSQQQCGQSSQTRARLHKKGSALGATKRADTIASEDDEERATHRTPPPRFVGSLRTKDVVYENINLINFSHLKQAQHLRGSLYLSPPFPPSDTRKKANQFTLSPGETRRGGGKQQTLVVIVNRNGDHTPTQPCVFRGVSVQP